MSYQTFKAEVLGGLQKAHDDKTKPAKVIAQAYVNLIARHFDIITGGGQVVAMPASMPGLQAGLQSVFLQSLGSQTKRMSQFNLWAPYIYTAWAGQAIVGVTGFCTILYTGNWFGPPIPENLDEKLWLDVLIGVISAHILTLTGTYTNYFTGITTPWSGALLQTFP